MLNFPNQNGFSVLKAVMCISNFAASIRNLFKRGKKEEISQAVDDDVNRVEDLAKDQANKTSQFYRQTEEDAKHLATDACEYICLNKHCSIPETIFF